MVREDASAHAMVWWGLLAAPFIYAGLLLFALPAPPPAFTLFGVAVLALMLNPCWTLEEPA